MTDFGIAQRDRGAPLTDAGQVIGTAHYMSPEQATGKQVTSASDIYSLGVIAYEMFAGRRPFDSGHAHRDLRRARPLPGPSPSAGGTSRRRRSDQGARSPKTPPHRPASAEAFAVRARARCRRSPGPTLTMPAATTAKAISAQPSPAPAVPRAVTGGELDRESRRTATTALLVFLAVLVLIAGGVWLYTTFGERRFDGGFDDNPTPRRRPSPDRPRWPRLRPRIPTATGDHHSGDGGSDDRCSDDGRPRRPSPAQRPWLPRRRRAGIAATVPPPTAAPTTGAPITRAPVLTPTPAVAPTDSDRYVAWFSSCLLRVFEGTDGLL